MQLADSQITLLVMLAVFVLCGGFMLVGATVLGRVDLVQAAPAADIIVRPAPEAAAAPPPPTGRPSDTATAPAAEPVLRLPFERDGRTNLVPVGLVYALHAEGHYTTAYLDHGPVFCPWSISSADERLTPHSGFMRVHRSWIVNLSLVSAYGRSKDHGYCIMAGASGLERVPVSRNRMAALQEALGF